MPRKGLRVTYKVNLAKLADKGEFPDEDGLKLKIGQEIIEKIKERTESGIDKNGKKLKSYSQAYKKSLPFKVHHKGSVNLKLTGDMLELLKVTDVGKNTITIGWDDEDIKDRAENHIHGVTVPKRDFLGLPDKELSSIMASNEALIERVDNDETTSKDEKILSNFVEADEV